MMIGSSGTGVDTAQIREIRAQLFKKADADQSGGLSLTEFTAVGQKVPAGPAESAGTSASDAAKAVFDQLDTNGDGTVSEAEMAAARPSRDRGASDGGSGLSADVLAQLLGPQEQSQSAAATDSSGGTSQIQELMQQLLRMLQQNGGATASSTASLSA